MTICFQFSIFIFISYPSAFSFITVNPRYFSNLSAVIFTTPFYLHSRPNNNFLFIFFIIHNSIWLLSRIQNWAITNPLVLCFSSFICLLTPTGVYPVGCVFYYPIRDFCPLSFHYRDHQSRLNISCYLAKTHFPRWPRQTKIYTSTFAIPCSIFDNPSCQSLSRLHKWAIAFCSVFEGGDCEKARFESSPRREHQSRLNISCYPVKTHFPLRALWPIFLFPWVT